MNRIKILVFITISFFSINCYSQPEPKTSVEQCKEAGIKVIMITGDHPETAGTIARELGLADENTPVVTGHMLADAGAYDSPAFEQSAASTSVFA